MAKKATHQSVKRRLDHLLVDRGIVESRERGQALILAGQVLVNGQKTEKAGAQVPEDADIRVLGELMPYVSRGGLKLEGALREFRIDVSGMTALDVGASTGGFTDCLLQHGCKRAYAIDVGYGQMAWKIRQDPRVVVFERMNIREMDPGLIPDAIDIAVIDVSFISLEKVVPAVLRFLGPGDLLLALIKPQFEAGRGQVGKGGIIRDASVRAGVVEHVRRFLLAQGCEVEGIIPSPITGQDGNVEYLILSVVRSGRNESTANPGP